MVKGLEGRIEALEQALVDGDGGESRILVGARRFQHALGVVYGEPGDTSAPLETAADAARFNREWDAALAAEYGQEA